MKHASRITAGATFALALGGFVGFNTSTSFAAPEIKAVICHAAGDKYVGIVVGIGSEDPNNPQLSNNGHLDENGNQLAGHEHDIYLGPGFEKEDCGKLPPPPK
jgi:hypothetical protein